MRYIHRQQGFLMVEVIIAITIISFALVSIASMFTQSMQANNNAADYTTAVNLAQKRLEILKTKRDTFWNNNCPKADIQFTEENLGANDPPEGYTIITKAVDFSVIDNDNSKNTVKLAQVTVSVEWDQQTASGEVKKNKVQLTSLFDKNP